MYHDHPSSRSPGSQRHQQPLHRQPSRQFDAYGPMPSNPYEDPLARYDTTRLERLNPLHNGGNYGYEISGSQTWNPNGFNGAHTLGGIGSATTRMKPPGRGRTGLPTVRARMRGPPAGVLTFSLDMARPATRPAEPVQRSWSGAAPRLADAHAVQQPGSRR
jgi:hypothetical protein